MFALRIEGSRPMLVPAVAATVLLLQAPTPPSAPAGPPPTPAAIAADTGALRHANGRTPPIATAVRVPGGSIQIDGRFGEPAWATAEPITNFTQQLPKEGEPATERTEVRIAYDDGAVYVAARMFDSDPSGIRTQLARRDAGQEADWFGVAFDSYHDHISSFAFSVNSSGVKYDLLSSQDGNASDRAWDPVWDVSSTRDSLGWTAELRIPLSQLRFPHTDHQVWGINIFRRIHRKAEDNRFAWSHQNERGFTSFFGHLFGLSHLPQPKRLELRPYSTAREERIHSSVSNNPFNDGSRQVASGGLDLKYGLTSNLTLDATVSPDFGQVEDDPAFVNLSAFEQFFSERRPFFVEGGDIFRFRGQQYFYSRRIGRPPQGSANSRGGFVDQPNHATILGAAKLSGRTGGGWSVGLLDAVTGREFATVDSAGVRFRDEVEPLTNFLVARGKRDFTGGSNQVGFILTAVNRNMDDVRLNFLRTSAYAGGIDFGHRFAKNRYNFTGSVGFSRIAGDPEALQRAQLSSARYYQRPDAGYVEYDPARTALLGWTASLNLGKEAGAYQYGISGSATSPGFELNDAGFQTRADRMTLSGFVNRRWTKPGKLFRSAFIGNNVNVEQNFGGARTGPQYNLNLNAQFLNYWGVNASSGFGLRSLSDGLTRGGPLAAVPFYWYVFAGVYSDSRKAVAGRFNISHAEDELGGSNWDLYTSFDLRPTSTIRFSIQPRYQKSTTSLQYLQSQSDPAATGTYGRQYVFSQILQKSLDLTTRLNVTFTPSLSLQLFTQPFVATGEYSRFKALARPGSLDYVVYGATPGSSLQCFDSNDLSIPCAGPGTAAYYIANPNPAGGAANVRISNRNFNSRSLRGNAVLRYEYRPGSTLYLVWTRSCSSFSTDPTFRAAEELQHLCQGPSDSVFGIKVNYWLSY